MGKRQFRLRQVGRALAAAGRMMLNYEVPRDAAAISYFGLLTLFPSILVLIVLIDDYIDAFFSWVDLHTTVLQSIISLFPGSRSFLTTNLNELTSPSTPVILSCVVVVLWSSLLIFASIENALNRAWGVSKQRSFWESRFRSVLLMVLGSIFLLISAGFTAIVTTARARTAAYIPEAENLSFIGWFWYIILLGAGFLVTILVFSFIFKLMPDRKVRWVEAFSGALISALLWEIGSYIFAILVPLFNYQRIYGRMGAVIALLAWVYTSSLILLFGANFSAQLHGQAMEDLEPDNSPIPVG